MGLDSPRPTTAQGKLLPRQRRQRQTSKEMINLPHHQDWGWGYSTKPTHHPHVSRILVQPRAQRGRVQRLRGMGGCGGTTGCTDGENSACFNPGIHFFEILQVSQLQNSWYAACDNTKFPGEDGVAL